MLLSPGAMVVMHHNRSTLFLGGHIRGSYGLVKRLIDGGADLHQREQCICSGHEGANFNEGEIARDATALYFASLYWDAQGLQALLDRLDNIADRTARDSKGRLPIHWTAVGPGLHDEYLLPEDDIVPRIVDTFKLLLFSSPDISVQDKHRETALHYAVGSHAGCGSRHSDGAIRFLCENGADASLQDSNGQTVLHIIVCRSIDGEPFNTALLDLLLLHGANISTTDKDGNIVLHTMARNLWQVNAAQFLLSRGADASITNSQGNTPVHEAMQGTLRLRETRDEKIKNVTLADRIRAQDEMVRVLQDAAGNRFYDLMEQPNVAGKTPRRIRDETRLKWRVMGEGRRLPGKWRGRPLH